MKPSHLIRGVLFRIPTCARSHAGWLPVLAATAMLGGASMAHAQASSGITGTVTDQAGGIIPAANITIVNVATQTTVTTVSSSAGNYTATGLLPGRYTVTVTAPGFSKLVKDQVNIEVATQATINFGLAPGEVETTVTVSSPLIALNTTQPELGTTIEPEVVNSLPVAIGGGRGRDIASLQFLAPGVQGSTFSHQINGGVDFQTEIQYNGIPVPQSETAGYTTNFNPPFELINEFRVERSTFSAKFGLAQGAVTYQTASGTNALHGDAFYINRNEFFDAKGYFNDVAPTDRENNYGFTLAGPVIIPHLYNGKNKTFFHFSLDFGKTNTTNTTPGTVPTAIEKTGDFSDFVDGNGKLIAIYDPTTGQQFQYNGRLNVIDPARISALAASLLPSIPNPDRPGLVGNKTYSPNAFPLVDHNYGFVIDHNLTQRQSIHYSQWRNSYSSVGFDNAPIVPITNILQSAKSNPALGSVFLASYTNAVTDKLVVTAGVLWVGEINNQFNEKRGVSFAGVTANPLADTFPNITFDGSNAPTNYGTASGWVQSINRKLGIAASNNWLWTKGRNTFNFGGEMRRTYQDDNECQACAGQFNFSQHSTASAAALGSTGSSFASFLIGQVDSADRIFANELRLRNLLFAPYIQDDIKFTPKLTINLGLRWDIMLPFVEKNNQIVYLNQTGANSSAGNLPGVAAKFGACSSPICTGINRADIHYKNFGPRFGFAYQISNRTVIQGGYSLTFLDGGAFEYGTSKVAVSYGNLLQGSYNANSTGGITPSYGSWDAKALPAPTAVALGAGLGIGTTIRAFDPKVDGRAPYLQQYSINIQHQLPYNTFLQVAYVGNHAIHLNGQLNPLSQPNPSILRYGALLQNNITDPAALAAGFRSPYANYATDLGGSATVAHTLSPFPQYSNVYNNFDLSGAAIYNGLQASLEKRFSNGLAFLTSYTLSRTMSNVDSGFSTFASLPENKYNQYAEFTVGGNDIENNAKISGTYDLPIGPGKQFVNNKGITGQIFGGLKVGFIMQYETGTPFGISENDNPLGCAGCFNRPNINAGATLSSTNYKNLGVNKINGQSTRQVFTTNAFTSTTGTFVLGNAQRNYPQLRNPGYYDEDVNATKRFALGDKVSFELSMAYFNVLNRVQFNGPNTNIDNGNYGFVSAGQNNTPRQGQLSGRVTF